jgi:hypothetical protein
MDQMVSTGTETQRRGRRAAGAGHDAVLARLAAAVAPLAMGGEVIDAPRCIFSQ